MDQMGESDNQVFYYDYSILPHTVLHITSCMEVDRYNHGTYMEQYINVHLIFIKLLPKLKSFSYDFIVRESTLEKLAEFCPNLENLELKVLTTLNCEPIFKSLTKLRKLRILFAPWIIQQIFSYLDATDIKYCVRTCKSWYDASFKQSFTDRLQFSLDENNINVVGYMKRKYRKVKLSYLNFTSHNVYYLKYFKHFGEHITELNIEKCRISINQLILIFKYLNNLVYLEIDDDNNIFNSQRIFSGKKKGYNRDILEGNLSKIKFFRLTSKQLNYGILEKFLFLLTNIEHLEFTMLSNPNCNTNFEQFVKVLSKIDMQNLRSLSISIEDKEIIVLDHFVAVDTSNIKALKLKLNGFSRNVDMLQTFCMKFTELEEFNINYNYPVYVEDNITDFPRYLSQYMVKLKRLYISQITSQFEALPRLEHLEVLHITTTRFRPALIGQYQNCDRIFVKFMPKLKSFVFDGNIGEGTLVKLCDFCPNLEQLELKSALAFNCESIFKNLLKLKKLRIIFGQIVFTNLETTNCIVETPVYTISRLIHLEELFTNLMIPNITEGELKKLPLLNRVITPLYSLNNKRIHNFNTKFL